MDLQNFIYLLLGLIWLIGFAWAGVVSFKSRRINNKTTLKTNESLNVNIGKMNARKLTTTYIRKDKR